MRESKWERNFRQSTLSGKMERELLSILGSGKCQRGSISKRSILQQEQEGKNEVL